MKEKFAAVGSLVVSGVLSTCCTLPLALAAFGLGTLGLGHLVRPMRPYMIGAALVLLAYGFYAVYRRRATAKSRLLIWFSAALFVVVVGTPYAVGWLRGSDDPLAVADEPGTRRVVVHVDDLLLRTCCEGPARDALDAIPGVRRVILQRRINQATLVVDAEARITNEDVKHALAAVDHSGHIK